MLNTHEMQELVAEGFEALVYDTETKEIIKITSYEEADVMVEMDARLSVRALDALAQ